MVLEFRCQGMERAIFGKHLFFQYVLGDIKSKETKKRMLKKVKHHGAVWKFLGCETMTWMVDPDYKVKADLHDNEKGEQEILRELLLPQSLFQDESWRWTTMARHHAKYHGKVRQMLCWNRSNRVNTGNGVHR